MGFDLDDYEKWASDFRQKGGEPCIKRYLEDRIRKLSAQEANNHRYNKTTVIKI